MEHNMDIIKNADWLIDIGLEASFRGGQVVFSGRLDEFINSDVISHTKRYMLEFLKEEKSIFVMY
ncbi:MAG: hypothetical protein N2169_03510 [bacterium]|nr:hypothetical protein [bacterium]